MISYLAAIMSLQNAAIWPNEKIGRHFAHLPVDAAPEAVPHRADPVHIEARQEHGQEEPKPRSLHTIFAVYIELWIRDKMKRVLLLACISADLIRRGMEESNDFEFALVQAGIVLREVTQSQVAHGARGIAIEHQQERPPGKLVQRDGLARDGFGRKRYGLIARFESHLS